MELTNIVRVQKNKDYTVINNASINDQRLSWKAKAIHVFMLSKPDNWTFYNEEIMKWATDGKDSFNSGLKELKKYGYVKKERRQGKDGKFDWVTVVYEVPQSQLLERPEKPSMENPHMDNKNKLNQGFDNKPNDQPYMENPSMEKPCAEKPSMEKPSVENPLTGKPSMENPQLLSTYTPSTDSLNTNIQNTNTTNTITRNLAVVESPQSKANVFEFYHRNGFGLTINDITREKIVAWCDDLSDELVVYAMQIAMERNKVSWTYAEGILRKWAAKNVRTIADVEALVAQFEAQKSQRNNSYSPNNKQEHVPDWFFKQRGTSSVVPREQPENAVDFEAERQKMLRKLQRS